jgi:acetyltransferase-like isoleucine patch superfamily enzyme
MIKLRKIFALMFTFFSTFTFGKIGYRSYIMFPNYIIGRKKIFIGENVHILYGFRCEVYKEGNIVISDNCSIGHNLHMTACADLYLGRDCVVSSNVFIGALDHDFTKKSVNVMSQPLICKKTYIGPFSFIGSGAVILPGSHVGKNSIVGANSVVKGFFPDNSIIVGNPAKILRIRE